MLAAGFLGGAKGRLLPASVPFRFFAATAVFHLAGWIVVLIWGGDFSGFAGGVGAPLGALHLITLGVLASTAMGAALQLLPVSTRQSIVAVWPISLAFWLFVPGVILFSVSAILVNLEGLVLGGGLAAAALAIFALLVADNLRRARGMAVVVAHGWAALAALVALLTLGFGSAIDFLAPILSDHQAAAGAHLVAAGYGFMGFLAVGFSYVLLPMFALSQQPSPMLAWSGLWLGCLALIGAGAGFFVETLYLLAGSILIGIWAAGCYLAAMSQVWKKRMRKRLGLPFVMIRIGWAFLPVSLIVALLVVLDVPIPNGPAIVAVLLLIGWQLTFMLGVLQRIMPFLGSMHAQVQPGSQSLVARFTDALELQISAIAHFLALALLLIGLIFDLGLVIQAAGACGVIGALAFGWFTLRVIRAVFAVPQIPTD